MLISCIAALPAMAEDSPHTVTGNLGLYSDYAFRGVSQTAAEPAIQGGFDYAHASGIYLGTWASNVTESMYADAAGNTSNLEWDVYGGYSGKIGADLAYNVGLLKYFYPGASHFDTLEAYAGITWKNFGLKASYNLADYFGAANSDGTVYWDASFNYELPAKVMLNLHYGATSAEGNAVDYNDWKIGVSKDFAGFVVGLAYTDTDLSDAEQGPVKGEDVKDGRLIVSVSKTF
ncbi:MAG: TorF family putative porin [Pseudomonadota bacterium]